MFVTSESYTIQPNVKEKNPAGNTLNNLLICLFCPSFLFCFVVVFVLTAAVIW